MNYFICHEFFMYYYYFNHVFMNYLYVILFEPYSLSSLIMGGLLFYVVLICDFM